MLNTLSKTLGVAVRALGTREIMKSVHLFLPFLLRHLDEVADLEDHPADCGVVLLGHRVLMPEAERARLPWAFDDERSWPWHVHGFIATLGVGLIAH